MSVNSHCLPINNCQKKVRQSQVSYFDTLCLLLQTTPVMSQNNRWTLLTTVRRKFDSSNGVDFYSHCRSLDDSPDTSTIVVYFCRQLSEGSLFFFWLLATVKKRFIHNHSLILGDYRVKVRPTTVTVSLWRLSSDSHLLTID